MAKAKAPAATPPGPAYAPDVVLTRPQLDEVVAAYSRSPYIVFDVETLAGRDQRTGGTKNADKPALDERTNEVFWIGLACPGRADIIPLAHPNGPRHLDRQEVLDALRPLFFSDRRKVNQNVAFDTLSLAKYWGGEVPPGPYTDLISVIHILNESLPSYALGSVVEHYLGFTYAKLAKDGVPMDTFPFWAVARYVGLDAKLTQMLYEYLLPGYRRRGAERLSSVLDLESDVTEVLIHMKHHGALVDRNGFERVGTMLGVELERVTEEIYAAVAPQLADESWDSVQPTDAAEGERRVLLLTSTQQKSRLLYGPPPAGLGLECKARTAKGATSTAEKVLKPLIRKHPVVRLLLKHAELSKLRSTYANGYTPHIGDDGRIRTNFRQHGAATGRLSSAQPNLQNLPRQSDDDASAKIRSLFIAPPGYCLVVGDFGQIEYRIMAHFAGPLVKTSRMLTAFRQEIDLHSMTASGLFSKPVEDVAKEERQAGKTANFLLMFGGGANKLLESGLTTNAKRADEIFAGFHRTYPEVRAFTEQTIARCRAMKHPYVETLWGRRRRLPDINIPRWDHDAGRIRAAAERQAVNHIIQGCLPADTRVLTRDQGWLPIGSFRDGSEVWTGNEWAPAIRLERGPAKRLRLHLSDGRTFDCDDRHKLLVNDGAWPRWATMGEVQGLELVRDHDPGDWGLELRDVEEMYWLGRMIGNGHLPTKGTWGLSFATADSKGPRDADRFTAFLDAHRHQFQGGSNSKTGYSVIRNQRGEVTQVVGGTAKGRQYWEFLGMQPGAHALQKRIPSVIFAVDRERRQAFFDGYYDADGRRTGRGTRITSANRPLLEDTLRLMNTLGMTGRIGTSTRKSDGYRWYDVYIHDKPHPLTVEEVEEVGYEEMYTLSVDHPRHSFSSEGLISKNTAADINKAAMVRTFRRIREAGYEGKMFLTLTVHDEIVIETPVDLADVAVALLREAMTGVKADLLVPLVADIHHGANWSDAK